MSAAGAAVQRRFGISSPSEPNGSKRLAPRFQVHARSTAERVLRAAERGESPEIADVRKLARAVLGADPMTALAVRLLLQPSARVRGVEVVELASAVLGLASASEPEADEERRP